MDLRQAEVVPRLVDLVVLVCKNFLCVQCTTQVQRKVGRFLSSAILVNVHQCWLQTNTF